MDNVSAVTSDQVTPEQIAWAKAYPFDVPQRSYVYAKGRALPLDGYTLIHLPQATVQGETGQVRLADLLSASQIMSLEMDKRHAVLACGSNASPQRLVQKFSDKLPNAVIPVLRAEVSEFCIVYAANITVYGSIPATFSRLAGASVTTFVTLLTDEQLDIMDETEQLGEEYDRPEFGDKRVTLDCGDKLPAVSGYTNRHGSFLVRGEPVALARVDGKNIPYLRMTQDEVQSAVHTALDIAHPLDHAIAQNISDAGLRLARAAELRDLHSRTFEGVPLR